MTRVCLQCGRTKEAPGAEVESHGYCLKCYLVFSKANGGIDFLTATSEQLAELKNDALDFYDGSEWGGESKIVYTPEQEEFYRTMIKEVMTERELKRK